MPRLTIGIPTMGRRPDLLERAIGSALAQSTPAAVLVADQTGEAMEIAQRFEDRGVLYHRTDATCLWDNWTAAAHACPTELFAWLQDDDVLSPHFAKRVQRGMDALPGCVLWMGRLGVSLVAGLANWWMATGPMVPMDLLHGSQTEVHPEVVTAASYFTSFALSPAVAFRCTTATMDAVARVPRDCDLYAERIVLAELAQLGKCIADPAIMGLWCIHDSNESRKQINAGGVTPQYATMARALDRHLTGPQWMGHLAGWALMQNPESIAHWLRETKVQEGVTPSFDAAHAVLSSVVAPVAAPPPEPQVETAEDKSHRKAERAVRKRSA